MYCHATSAMYVSLGTVLLYVTIFAAAKSLQSCPTLCDPIDGSPTGSPVPGILQARILEWVAISFSNTWKWKVKVKSFSRVQLLATPWTAAYQAPLSMGFSRQEYWSGVPLPSPCDYLYWMRYIWMWRVWQRLSRCSFITIPSQSSYRKRLHFPASTAIYLGHMAGSY